MALANLFVPTGLIPQLDARAPPSMMRRLLCSRLAEPDGGTGR